MLKRCSVLLAVMVAALAGPVFAAPAGAQYPLVCVALVDPPVVTAGQTVDITGNGAPPGATVEARINGVLLGSAVADADGNYVFTDLGIPSNLAPGDYSIQLTVAGGLGFDEDCGDVDTVQVGVTVQVPPRPGGGGASGLPPTGSDSLSLLQAAAALVAIGGLLVLAARKRNERVPA